MGGRTGGKGVGREWLQEGGGQMMDRHQSNWLRAGGMQSVALLHTRHNHMDPSLAQEPSAHSLPTYLAPLPLPPSIPTPCALPRRLQHRHGPAALGAAGAGAGGGQPVLCGGVLPRACPGRLLPGLGPLHPGGALRRGEVVGVGHGSMYVCVCVCVCVEGKGGRGGQGKRGGGGGRGGGGVHNTAGGGAVQGTMACCHWSCTSPLPPVLQQQHMGWVWFKGTRMWCGCHACCQCAKP